MSVLPDAMRIARHEELRWLLTPRYWPGSLLQSQKALAELHQASDAAAKDGEAIQLTPIFYNTEQACRALRFEIDRDHEPDLLQWLHRNHALQKMPWELEGPYQFMGVDVYLVPNLPAPGWRIINPMRK